MSHGPGNFLGSMSLGTGILVSAIGGAIIDGANRAAQRKAYDREYRAAIAVEAAKIRQRTEAKKRVFAAKKAAKVASILGRLPH